ncbi:MAG: HAMP domain-containing protein [Deltaproteobacteria bacterium]|nr:HAMP domain-containing protein [Deltaproteobacteria bacterium]
MTAGIYLRVALSVGFAALVSGALLFVLLVPQGPPPGPPPGPPVALPRGLRRAEALAMDLERLPESERPRALARRRGELRGEVALIPREEVPRELQPLLHPGELVFAQPPAPPRAYIPLRGERQYLMAGPAGPPRRVRPRVELPLLFVFLVSVLSGAMVAVPLARRLRRLEQGVEELARGRLDTQLRAEGVGDGVGRLASGINRMARRLKQLLEGREQLLQAVSHELGTPLARLRLNLELLRASLEGDGRQRRIAAMQDDLDELSELAQELVNWVEADALVPERAELGVQDALEPLVELRQAEARAGVEVLLEAPEEAVTARVHPRYFLRAVENVLRNAARFARTQVVLRVEPSRGGVLVQIDDDGPGIPVDYREKVLEPFGRLEAGHSQGSGGVGLGLAITRRIVERHEGTITLAEAPGGGTRVDLWWPG